MASRSSQAILAHVHRVAGSCARSEQTDVQLLSHFIESGNEAAFTAMIERHGPMVRDLCRRLLRQESDADDVFQATFLVLLRKAPSIRKYTSLGSWLYGVAYRLACKANRRIARETERENVAVMEHQHDPSIEASWREMWTILDEELSRLSDAYRPALVLCYLQGRTHDEAARQLGWSVRTLRRKLDRGRELLRLRLSRRGVVFPAVLLAAGLCNRAARASISARLLYATARMRCSVAAGNSAGAGGASAKAIGLANGLLQTMAWAPFKLAFGLCLVFTTVLMGTGILALQPFAPQPLPQIPDNADPAVRVRELDHLVETKQQRVDQYGDPLPDGALARLGTTRFRHPHFVTGVAFAPDGKTLASTCCDGAVRLWESNTGKEFRRFTRTPNPILGQGEVTFNGAAITRDGTLLVAIENLDTAHVWDLASGKEVRQLKGRYAFGMALSPDDRTLAIGESGELAGRQVSLWDLATGRLLRVFGARGRPVSALAFSPDGKVLATGESAAVGVQPNQPEFSLSSIRCWDVATGQRLRELKGHTGGVTAVSYSADGTKLLSASHDATLRSWDVATGLEGRSIQVVDNMAGPFFSDDQVKGVNYGGILSAVYSPDGKWIASGSHDGTVHLWDAVTGAELHTLHGHGRGVTTLAFSPDGKRLASGSWDLTIRVWDPLRGKPLQPWQGHDGTVRNLALSPDGRLAAVACEDRTVRVWSLATNQQIHTLRGHTDFVYAVAFASDSRTIFSGSADGTVRIWDCDRGQEARRFSGNGKPIMSLALAEPLGLLATAELHGALHFWDIVSGEQFREVRGMGQGSALQMPSDGKTLATATNKAVYILDTRTGKELRRFEAGVWQHFALSPDGQTLATQRMSEHTIHFWNVATGKEFRTLGDQHWSAGFAGARPFVFSQDARLLARPAENKTIELWEVQTGKVRRRFQGHEGRMGPFACAFSADGKLLVSGGDDTTVLVWDVTRRQETRPERLAERDLQDLWRDLGDVDGEKTDRAIWTLVVLPDQSVPFLDSVLSPTRSIDAKRIQELVADLDSPVFAKRDHATRELDRYGEAVLPALNSALAQSASPELHRRAEPLLNRQRPPSPDQWPALRAVEVLERIGTPAAQRLLEKLAHGAPEALLTKDAASSLGRLRTGH
jgi:RNA polymerase sigma factor (sigma-70 family)